MRSLSKISKICFDFSNLMKWTEIFHKFMKIFVIWNQSSLIILCDICQSLDKVWMKTVTSACISCMFASHILQNFLVSFCFKVNNRVQVMNKSFGGWLQKYALFFIEELRIHVSHRIRRYNFHWRKKDILITR